MAAGWCEKLPHKLVKSTPVQLEKSYGRLYKHNQCHYLLKHLQDGEQISVHMPPDIAGHWVSERYSLCFCQIALSYGNLVSHCSYF